jgi:hypothetical protein
MGLLDILLPEPLRDDVGHRLERKHWGVRGFGVADVRYTLPGREALTLP